MIDYKALLEKYMQHVGACEGSTFMLPRHRQESKRYGELEFSDEEGEALERIEAGEDD